MSYRQRIIPLLLVSFVGITSGVYVFDPLLKQYAIDSRGTYDPKIAQAGVDGGVGGGVNDVNKIGQVQPRDGTGKSSDNPTNVLNGVEARKKLEEVLQSNSKSSSSSTSS